LLADRCRSAQTLMAALMRSAPMALMTPVVRLLAASPREEARVRVDGEIGSWADAHGARRLPKLGPSPLDLNHSLGTTMLETAPILFLAELDRHLVRPGAGLLAGHRPHPFR
ncbi:MAG TPA: hypothetical protein VFR23_19500, partial [Jiangellaceae bacterium]|nr:hypothetical protein [Jiangellaceae bacterium]